MLKTGANHLLMGENCHPKTGHQDLEHCLVGNRAYLMVTGAPATSISSCSGIPGIY